MKTICLMATVLLFLLVNTQEAQSQDNSETCDVDLYVCIDLSTSVSHKKIQEEKNFSKNYIDELGKKVRSIKKIKVITFATNAWDITNHFNGIEKTKEAIDKIERVCNDPSNCSLYTSTMPDLCLEKVNDIFRQNDGIKTNTIKILLLSTDGNIKDPILTKMKVLIKKLKDKPKFIVQAAVYLGHNTQKLEEIMNSANVYSNKSKNNIALEALEISPCSKLETCSKLRLDQSNRFNGIPKTCTGIRVGENCDFECPGELKPNEYKTIRCLVNKTWDYIKNYEYCEKPVPCVTETQHIDNGEVIKCEWREKCEFVCNEGYYKYGYSQCQQGKITGDQSCQRNSCDNQSILKGQITNPCMGKDDCSRYTNCDSGYEKNPSHQFLCDEKRKIIKDDICIGKTCKGITFDRGSIIENCISEITCVVSCKDGYTKTSLKNYKCDEDRKLINIPAVDKLNSLCVAKKCNSETIGNGLNIDNCFYGQGTCDFTCDLGYSNQGAFKCGNDGKFETRGICVADTCRDKPDIPNGVINDCKTGEGCDTVCNRHYRKNAVREFFCTDGVYVGNVTCSLITCSHKPHLPNATEVSLAACVTNSRAGEDCQHLCAHGFAHFGTLRCDADGNWNTSAANCTRVCSLPPEIEHSDPESPKNCANAFENQTCPVTCAKDAKTGFTPVCARKSDADPALVWKNTKYACYIDEKIQPYTLITSIMTTASFAASILSLALAFPTGADDIGAAVNAFYDTGAGDDLEFTIADPDIFILG